MNFIKLNAIDSTNNFVKGLIREKSIQKNTLVWTENQTNGRGQLDAKWQSEPYKNLTFSLYFSHQKFTFNNLFDLNILVALSLIELLEFYHLPLVTIKWPNDIMSEKNKICGILIENLLQADSKINSVIGIGLNVNQDFFEALPQASSMKIKTNVSYDLEDVLQHWSKIFEKNIDTYTLENSEEIWNKYHEKLFKINQPITILENSTANKFMCIIRSVNKNGLLQVELEDETLVEYAVKEIKMHF